MKFDFTMQDIKNITQCMAIEYKDNKDGWYTEKRGYSYDLPYGEGVEFSSYPDCGHIYKVNDKTCLVVFKGTHNLKGWLENMKCIPKPSEFADDQIPITKSIDTDVMVHPGFQEAWKKMRLQVYTCIASFEKVIITGHSRGGAIAMGAAENTKYDTGKDVACIPYCPARYGNGAFVREYANKVDYSLCFAFGNDPVPHTPPEEFGYKNIPQYIKLTPQWFQPQYWLLPFNPTAHYPEHQIREIPRQMKGRFKEEESCKIKSNQSLSGAWITRLR